MNTIDFSHRGGFPLETDTLIFLQTSMAEPINALAGLGGDKYILSGVEDQGSRTTDGWVVIDGEVLYFKGDLKQNSVIIVQTGKKAHFENGKEHEVYLSRYATFGTGPKSIPFASLPRINDLQKQKKRADDLRADHEAHKVHVVKRTGELQTAHDAHKADVVKRTGELQTAHEAYEADAKKRIGELQTAYNTLKDRVAKLEKVQFVRGMILAWSGSISSIPTGWQLCEKLADRFILGAGRKYIIGATGGEEEHRLLPGEMPVHHHQYGLKTMDNKYGVGYWHIDQTWKSTGNNQTSYYQETSATAGADIPHNNMPPYYALAYIEYVG